MDASATRDRPEPDLTRMRSLVQRAPVPSQRWPVLRPVAVAAHRTRRRVQWLRSGADWAATVQEADLPVLVASHDSPLLRHLDASEMPLQHNKVTNLRLAAVHLDGLVIGPGQTFSFNRTVGSCTRRRGYLPGMTLSGGQVASGVGGGLCQLANMIHWLVLHSALTVSERSDHDYDAFPDEGRVVPWGVGCAIAYNYVDLQLRNDTTSAFQLRMRVGGTQLHGALRADDPPPVRYRVYAAHERFYRLDGAVFRTNEIWRSATDTRTGVPLGEELVRRNCALVRYVPAGAPVEDLTGAPAAQPGAPDARG